MSKTGIAVAGPCELPIDFDTLNEIVQRCLTEEAQSFDLQLAREDLGAEATKYLLCEHGSGHLARVDLCKRGAKTDLTLDAGGDPRATEHSGWSGLDALAHLLENLDATDRNLVEPFIIEGTILWLLIHRSGIGSARGFLIQDWSLEVTKHQLGELLTNMREDLRRTEGLTSVTLRVEVESSLSLQVSVIDVHARRRIGTLDAVDDGSGCLLQVEMFLPSAPDSATSPAALASHPFLAWLDGWLPRHGRMRMTQIGKPSGKQAVGSYQRGTA
jgi:hypothetical protein